MDLSLQQSLNKFQEKNEKGLINIYDLKSNKTLFSLNSSTTTTDEISISYIHDNIQQTQNIVPSATIDIVTIDRLESSTKIKFLNRDTVLVISYLPSIITLSEVSAFIAKFTLKYRDTHNLSQAS